MEVSSKVESLDVCRLRESGLAVALAMAAMANAAVVPEYVAKKIVVKLPEEEKEEANNPQPEAGPVDEDDERSALSSINLKMDGEKMTALIGLSGAGKSTILNLLSRFYDRNSGDILIDDQSIYKTTLYFRLNSRVPPKRGARPRGCFRRARTLSLIHI